MRIVDRFDAFLIDIDGTVEEGAAPVARAVASLKKLKKTGKPFLFLTNNARLSPGGWAKKFRERGIDGVRAGDVVTSATSTARFIERRFKDPCSKRAFVAGSSALVSEIRKTGISLIKHGEVSCGCDVVIVGGHKGFNYSDIAAAGTAVRNGAVFLATNSNFVYPAGNGEFMPATGALAAAVEKVSRKRPVITGKPHPGIFKMCMKILGTGTERTAVIGDSLKTDIKGGKRAGIKTVLTLTGISSRADIQKSRHKPDYVIEDLSGLFG